MSKDERIRKEGVVFYHLKTVEWGYFTYRMHLDSCVSFLFPIARCTTILK